MRKRTTRNSAAVPTPLAEGERDVHNTLELAVADDIETERRTPRNEASHTADGRVQHVAAELGGAAT